MAAGEHRPVLGRDGPDPGGIRPASRVDHLIHCWLAWEQAPGASWTAAAKCDALLACGLDVCDAHEAIAAARRAGYSVPSAVQAAVNDSHQEAA